MPSVSIEVVPSSTALRSVVAATIAAVGALLGSVTTTVDVVVLVAPLSSVTVRVTSLDPAVA